MEYAQEVLARIRETKNTTDYEAIGRGMAAQWIASEATYDEIRSIAVHYLRPNRVTAWIAKNQPCPGAPVLYTAFNEEVRRFWDKHKNDL